MENSAEGVSISELKLYQNRFSLFQILNTHNPVKLFQRFSELQNEVNVLRNENRELFQENEKLRNHFTHWYIQDGIDSRQPSGSITLNEEKSSPGSGVEIKKICYEEISTQTDQPLLDISAGGSTNVTIRLEIVTNGVPEDSSPSPGNIKDVKVHLPNLKKSDTETTKPKSDPAEADCVDSDIICDKENEYDHMCRSMTTLVAEIEKFPEPSKKSRRPVNEKPIKSCLLHSEDHEPPVPEILIPFTVDNLQKRSRNEDNASLSEGPVPVMCQTRKRSALKNIFSRSKSSDKHQAKDKEIQNPGNLPEPAPIQPPMRKEYNGAWAKKRKPDCDCDAHKIHINPEYGVSSFISGLSFNSEAIETDPVSNNKDSICKQQEPASNIPQASTSKLPHSRRPKRVTYD